MVCPNCQTPNRDTAYFCLHCGTVLACPRCRSALPLNANYCDNCGQPLAAGTGPALVERVGDAFAAEGNDVEWMMYGWSVLHCLPIGMAEQPSAGTGAVTRLDTLRRYAAEAGFRSVEILPVDNFFFRFYRLSA